MDKSIKMTIWETIARVFETMFFTFLEPLPRIPRKEEWPIDIKYIRAVVSITGKEDGKVALYLPRDLARNITINFLGITRSEVSQNQILDTAKETANMAVGSLLGTIDPEGLCVLGIPNAMPVVNLEQEDKLNDINQLVGFKTDCGMFLVYVKIGDVV